MGIGHPPHNNRHHLLMKKRMSLKRKALEEKTSLQGAESTPPNDEFGVDEFGNDEFGNDVFFDVLSPMPQETGEFLWDTNRRLDSKELLVLLEENVPGFRKLAVEISNLLEDLRRGRRPARSNRKWSSFGYR